MAKLSADEKRARLLSKPLLDACGKRPGRLGRRVGKHHGDESMHLLDKFAEQSERAEKRARRQRERVKTGFKKYREELRDIKERAAMVICVSRMVLPDGSIRSEWK